MFILDWWKGLRADKRASRGAFERLEQIEREKDSLLPRVASVTGKIRARHEKNHYREAVEAIIHGR